jgi:hypothetical protein
LLTGQGGVSRFFVLNKPFLFGGNPIRRGIILDDGRTKLLLCSGCSTCTRSYICVQLGVRQVWGGLLIDAQRPSGVSSATIYCRSLFAMLMQINHIFI